MFPNGFERGPHARTFVKGFWGPTQALDGAYVGFTDWGLGLRD